MSVAEHADRRNHHRQPRPTTHWGKGTTPHPGPVRPDCPDCLTEKEAAS